MSIIVWLTIHWRMALHCIGHFRWLVAEAYTTQPNKETASKVHTVHIFSLLGGLTVGVTKRCTHMSPPRMRSNAVGGGGVLYWLGVGRCSYDASTG